ncbi:SGNH/GDSL hydrolase family protein [Nocardioides pyridinolyticus]
MRPLLAAVALAAALTACSGDAEPEPLPARETGAPVGAPTVYDQYVALGDSYTAAPLVPPTDTSTRCLRSAVNYPALVAEQLPGTELTDVSCSSAATRHTLRPQAGDGGSVPPQFDALRPGTDLVTVGLGGNDERLFGGTLGNCVAVASQDPTGSPCTDAARGGRDIDRILARITDNLVQVVAGIEERSPDARILLIGYPQLIPASGTCDDLPLAEGDYAFARTINHGLARAVERAAEEAGVEFVDLWEPSAGHDICADEPWINGRVTSATTALAYHPLAVEQQAVADLVLEELAD